MGLLSYKLVTPLCCEGIEDEKTPHPTQNLKVKKGRKTRWISTTVDLDSHIIVPEINSSEIEFPNRFVEDYISNCTKTPLDISKPLWELHLINIKTSDSDSTAVLRMHHSMGDGASLLSLLIASTRKSSDPNALPTMPTTKKKNDEKQNRGGASRSFLMLLFAPLMALWWGLVLMWHTFVDLMMFALTFMFLKDTWTPLKGSPGVELNTKRYVHRIVSMDDIKLLKKAMNATINDVLLGITQAGITRYLNREELVVKKKRSSGVLKNIRLRAAILVNIRPVAGIQDLADMMAEKSKVRWGNWIGYIMLPFSIASQEDPLEHVRQAKATIDRKKHSLEAVSTFACAKLILNLFGVKVAAAIIRRILLNTTLAFSNLPGPVEEVSFYGHPVAYIAPSVYGHPQVDLEHRQKFGEYTDERSLLDKVIIILIVFEGNESRIISQRCRQEHGILPYIYLIEQKIGLFVESRFIDVRSKITKNKRRGMDEKLRRRTCWSTSTIITRVRSIDGLVKGGD
ncbi:hypothetical protein PIB30_065599 [Stylosanthes scabra]|uniref:Diacylglycerol O-acyltransferase n=1 Tax=Stylosanthes scabra TaxID=79078 RepID=A0ABU6RMB0_9FABA|nr:hypothetical protein [Stylosanthes scabra]